MRDNAKRYDYKVSVHRNTGFIVFLNTVIYEVAKIKIKRIGLIDCERIGSSDIKCIYSKRIIDIMVSGENVDISAIASLLLKRFPRSREIDLGSEMPDRKMIRVYSLFRSIPRMHIHIVEWEYWCKSRERKFHRLLQNDLSVHCSIPHIKRN